MAPLTMTVQQRGAIAVAARSGTPLTVSPTPWIEGCPRIHNFWPTSEDVDAVAYLDPETGDLLAVDVAPTGWPCSFESAPARWTDLAQTGSKIAAE